MPATPDSAHDPLQLRLRGRLRGRVFSALDSNVRGFLAVMTKHDTQRTDAKRRIFTPVAMAWSVAGALSAAYIVTLLVAPGWLDDIRSSTLDPQTNQGQRAAARLAGEISALRDSVSQIQLDLAKVKTDTAAFSEREKVLTSQIVALEQKASPVTAGDIQATAPIAPASATQAAAPAPAPPAANGVAVALDPASTALETGSVETAAKSKAVAAASADGIAFGPAVVKPAPKKLGVKLSNGASLDALRLSWSLLAERHGDALKNLEARYTASGDAANPSYDLIAGPLKSAAEANKVCKALAARNVPCKVGDFTGDTL